MRCTHAEKLIPLFAGDDLPARQATALQRHLESCANCRQLAAEFEESRDWLSRFAAPEFDEAMLDGLRDSVLKEIGQEETRPGLLEWILPGWNPRFAFAASLALLLLVAVFGLLAYRRQQPHAPKHDQAEVKKGAGNQVELPRGKTPDEQANKDEQIANRKPDRRELTRKPIKPRLNESPQTEAQTVEPDLIAQKIETAEPATDPAKDDLASNREMTRIEFQTADPNIRIIWLTPKDSGPSAIKPNTNR